MTTATLPVVFDPDRLRSARQAAGLSQRAAAKAAGVARATIHNAEHGTTIPGAESLARIAQVYRVPMDSLFTHGTEPNTRLDGRGFAQNQQPDEEASGANLSPRPAPHGG